MKSKLLYLMMFALAAFSLTGCDDESTAGMTRITYYPTIEVLGSPSVVLNLGESYADEGCYAELNGEDVSGEVVVRSGVNSNKVGIYSISYMAYNEDGFSASASRTVYVVDPTSVATLYFGESQTSTRHYYDAPIYITDNGDGTYLVDDLIGGFQFNGVNAGLEPSYDFHAEAVISIAADNTVSQIGETGSWYFGDRGTVVKLETGTFDPATRTFVLNIDYGGTPLTVTLRAITK
ncbi:DUF5011 domain-containing protein [Bacteroides sp.]|uniref:DUF5011 domain-containing protein n=1 Tax=Bacteroides sp. TaxID=29523 RepID=UPI003AB3A9ED